MYYYVRKTNNEKKYFITQYSTFEISKELRKHAIELPDQCVACLQLSNNLFILGDATENEFETEQINENNQFRFTKLWLGEKSGNTIKKRQKLWEPVVNDLLPSLSPLIKSGNWKSYINNVRTQIDKKDRLWIKASTLCGEEFYFRLTPSNNPIEFCKENIEYYKKMKFIKDTTFFIIFWSTCHFIHMPTAVKKMYTFLNQLLTTIKRQ